MKPTGDTEPSRHRSIAKDLRTNVGGMKHVKNAKPINGWPEREHRSQKADTRGELAAAGQQQRKEQHGDALERDSEAQPQTRKQPVVRHVEPFESTSHPTKSNTRSPTRTSKFPC